VGFRAGPRTRYGPAVHVLWEEIATVRCLSSTFCSRAVSRSSVSFTRETHQMPLQAESWSIDLAGSRPSFGKTM